MPHLNVNANHVGPVFSEVKPHIPPIYKYESTYVFSFLFFTLPTYLFGVYPRLGGREIWEKVMKKASEKHFSAKFIIGVYGLLLLKFQPVRTVPANPKLSRIVQITGRYWDCVMKDAQEVWCRATLLSNRTILPCKNSPNGCLRNH